MIQFEGTEQEAQDKLMDVMHTIINTWDLQYNHDELTRAVHNIQLFIWQKALQREGAACGDWFKEPNA